MSGSETSSSMVDSQSNLDSKSEEDQIDGILGKSSLN